MEETAKNILLKAFEYSNIFFRVSLMKGNHLNTCKYGMLTEINNLTFPSNQYYALVGIWCYVDNAIL